MSDITVEEVRCDSPLPAHPVLIFLCFTLYLQLTKELAESSCKIAPESVEGLGVTAETLVDDGISGNAKNPEIHFKPVRYLLERLMFSSLTAFLQMELPQFDVLVFHPEAMPVIQNASSNLPATVWRDWRKLTLNPYIAYASCLSVVDRRGEPLPQDALREVSNECLAIRSRWDVGPV